MILVSPSVKIKLKYSTFFLYIFSKKFHRLQFKRSVLHTLRIRATEHWIYNLTGDTIDIGNNDLEADGEIEIDRSMENLTVAHGKSLRHDYLGIFVQWNRFCII